MELIALPDFHHELLALCALIFLIIAVWIGVRLLPKRYKSFKIHSREDLYEASRILSSCHKFDALLQELNPYKYAPATPPLPRELRRRVEKAVDECKREEKLIQIKERARQKIYNVAKKNRKDLLWKFLKMLKR
ncbi:hypothetical protein [Nitratiruptor sp. YY09-18]|uniref:hypothetical protein n=1 Tax=Nitratiruptor sp. YY09-18 TaxID=2724901 RepID=UPI0019161A38|nr:hypothetical protein [Nitratiruptor sp. YY09-18]BCD68893.1 hypothetical protein NitYY0918_C1812 [Nitratiruptor sp. YY09-18]